MDIDASNWTEADASNTTAAPDGAPEGMAPSGVNDVLRAMMGATKRWFNRNAVKLTSGTSTAYTLGYTIAPGALVDGTTFLVQFHIANGNAPTLQVNLLAACPLHYFSYGAWRQLPPSLFADNAIYRVAHNQAAGSFRLLGREDRTGTIVDFAGATAPVGTLLCYGQPISRTTYAGLFAALGTVHGAGDGSTTFNLPDLRSRATIGKSDMGGSDAGNLAGGGMLGAALGTQSQAFAVSGSASGTLNGMAVLENEGPAPSSGDGYSAHYQHTHNVSVSGTLSVSGATDTRSIVQPSRVMNKIIRI